jgi:acyl dehydratase
MRNADFVCDLPTTPQAALIYRLSADTNPLHADPDVANAAGFPRPILHGLATYGVAGHAILKTVCDYDPTRLKALAGRFTAPVYPGETFRTEIWIDDGVASFRTTALERNVVAISNGRAEFG